MAEVRRQVVCALADLPDPGARGFSPPGAAFADEYFLVRRGGIVRAYRNCCPHAGNCLNWKPDAFLTRDQSLIMCSVHGALFDPVSGRCVGGPCPGKSLDDLPARVEDGSVVVYFGEIPPNPGA